MLEGANGEDERSDCVGWKAIYPSRQDQLSRGTIDQILAHNQNGADRGCWEDPST